MQHLILVCHAADGHFADGNREGIRRVLAFSSCIAQVEMEHPWYTITCVDGGWIRLHAPGLDEARPFHRMELFLETTSWTPHVLRLLFEFMRAGNFGLIDGLDACQVLVTLPQQVAYFPHLPESPLLVRDARDLGHTIGYPVV